MLNRERVQADCERVQRWLEAFGPRHRAETGSDLTNFAYLAVSVLRVLLERVPDEMLGDAFKSAVIERMPSGLWVHEEDKHAGE